MKRLEFSRKTRAAAFLRSGGCCEECGAKLKTGEGEYDHDKECWEGGDDSLENCRVLCKVCHEEKTGEAAGRRSKADRQRDKHNGTWKRKTKPVPGSKDSGWRKPLNGPAIRREK